MDINEIKAGEYQLVAVRWDERTSKPGEPFTFRRHRRGDKVRLSEADAKRLVMAGAVVKPGELEQRAADAARRQYRALLAQMPDELRNQLLAEDAAEAQAALSSLQEAAGVEVVDPEDGSGEPERPPQTANKAVWLEFRGLGDLTEEQAEAITLKQLKDDEYMASYQRPAGDPGTQPGV